MPLFLLKFLPLILKLGKAAVPFLNKNWKSLFPILLVLIMGFTIHIKDNKIDSLELDKVMYARWQQDATAANLTNQMTIASLRHTNKSLAQAVVVSEEVRAEAYRKAREWELRAAIQLDDAKAKLKELENETPTCAEISRIDIGAACPLSVELLRRAAAGDFD